MRLSEKYVTSQKVVITDGKISHPTNSWSESRLGNLPDQAVIEKSQKYPPKSGFTLLELLAVMLIMFMLMGMGTVAMKGLIQGSGISGAYSNIKSVLTQARQYAITKEQRVYVIFAKNGEKNSMTVCAKYGESGTTGRNQGGDHYVISENPLPWGTNTLNDGTVYNLDNGRHAVISGNDSQPHPRTDTFYTGGNGLGWSRGDDIGFGVADVRYLPSGMEFDDDTGDLTLIFNPDGSAENMDSPNMQEISIIFREMYIAGSDEHELEVDKLTGWVSVP